MAKKIQNNTPPVDLATFRGQATEAARDGKLTDRERRALSDGFKQLDRSAQLEAADFLKGESKPLAAFARSFAVTKSQVNRVGGDVSLDRFQAAADKASADGFSAGERSQLAKEFRALSKSDQAAVLAKLEESGDPKLKRALESSLAPAAQPADGVEPEARATFDAALEKAMAPDARGKAPAGLEGLRSADRAKVIDIFRGLSQEDQQQIVGELKNKLPRLAVTLDRILNPRPEISEQPPSPFASPYAQSSTFPG